MLLPGKSAMDRKHVVPALAAGLGLLLSFAAGPAPGDRTSGAEAERDHGGHGHQTQRDTSEQTMHAGVKPPAPPVRRFRAIVLH